MKRVLVLNQFALPRDQGGGTRHVDLFSRLDGWSFVILAGNRNHYTQESFTTKDSRFRLIRVPSQDGGARQRLASWLAYCAGAAVRGLRWRPDVVYASSPHLLAPLTGWILSRLTRASFVLEVRDLWPESFVAAGLLTRGSHMHQALSRLERFLVRRADEVVGVTVGWEPHFSSLGASMDQYTVVTNGTETSEFDIAESREALRQEQSIAGVTAIFAGAHGPKDGIECIIDAARSTPDVNFLLVGDGPLKEWAQREVQQEAISNVSFRAPVAKGELARLLKACDIGIHAVSPLPVFELGMSPNKLFDYLAAGLPVVSNAGEPVSRLVGDRECALVGGPDSLAANISRLRDLTHSQRVTRGAEGRSLVDTKFSRTKAARSLQRILERSLPSSRELT